jgi:ABC-type antimicrobial peptide transport system permease subunit
MKLNDVFWLTLKGLRERKLRTGLTILSVVIGIAAIVALVSQVAGISASISKSLSSIGPTSIVLIPRGQEYPLTGQDVAEISALSGVKSVIPMVRGSANISVGGTEETVTLIGVDNQSISSLLGGVNIYEGSQYSDGTPLSLVGYQVAFPTTGTGPSPIGINQPIYLQEEGRDGGKTITLIVAGILDQYGSSLLVPVDTSVFTSLSTAMTLLGESSYNMLLVVASNTSSANTVYTLLTNIYGSRAEILSVQQITAIVASITGSIGVLLGSIAGISLIVAGISILSIMMVSVSERTKEIGILKSIGFKNSDVMMLFLTEAVIIGALGGCLGVAVGAGGSYALPILLGGASKGQPSGTAASTGAAPGGASYRGNAGFGGGGATFVGGGGPATPGTASSLSYTPIISPSLVVMAIAIALIVSIIASLYPSRKASMIDPIAALRNE